MVIRLTRLAGFREAFRYNENKVSKEKAQCIHAGNYILDPHQLSVRDKTARFLMLEQLRPDLPKKGIHVSIGFHPDDRPDKEKMIRVTADWLRELGYASQPWLLYQHSDTRHPHVHLIAPSITVEGKFLPTYREFQHAIEVLRRLEQEYHLVPSLARAKDWQIAADPAQPAKRQDYGRSSTTKSIAKTLEDILPNYSYTSLTELNALLRQYNVWADNGKPGGYLASVRGLSYQMLDPDGKAIGRRIGAGRLDLHPGLDYLEARFRENEQRESTRLNQLATRVRLAGLRAPDDWQRYAAELRAHGVEPVPFMNPRQQIYDIVFIDHPQKQVAAVNRLIDRASLKHLHVQPAMALGHQRDLLRDMRRAQEQLNRHQPAEHARTREKQQEHEFSR